MSIKKKIFVQEWGTFPSETLVCVGVSVPYIKTWLKKNNCHVTFLDDSDAQKRIDQGVIGFSFVYTNGQSIMWLRDYSKKNLEDIETLMHEVHHLVYFMAIQKGFENEYEAKAYQFTYLFRNIRRRLNENHNRNHR